MSTRVYYPSQALFVKRAGAAGAYSFVHGVQTASDDAQLPKQDINQWGQLEVYQRIEDTPEISLDVERVLDGYAPLYLAATVGSTLASLTGRQDKESILAIGIYSDTADYVGQGTADPVKIVEFSGMQVNSISYSFTTDGAFTESLNFIGNYMEWSDGDSPKYGTLPADPTGGGDDEPLAKTDCLGGVQFKESLVFDSGEDYHCILPTQIPGIKPNGRNEIVSGQCPTVNIQSVEISADLSRERIPSLGCRGDYAKLATFPVDVNVSISILLQEGHQVSVTENGALPTGGACPNDRTNSPDQSFRLVTKSGLVIDCGDKLKLDGVSTSYGDASGGNATADFTFVGKSILSVYHVADPSSIALP